jgi:hypothetical protein
MRSPAVLLLLAMLAAPASAAAEWHITPMVGLTFAGKTTLQDFEHATGNVHPAIGITGTYLTRGIFGFEGMAVLTPGFFQDGGELIKKSRTVAVMGNVVITVPQRWTEYSLRPFVSGGVGVLRSTQDDNLALLPVNSQVAGFNIGGGAVGYFSATTGVRFDVRYYSNFHGVDERGLDQGAIALGDVHLRYMTASVGFVIRR